MKIQQWFFKKLRKQNITDRRTHTQTDKVKTVYPPQTKFAGGINIRKLFEPALEILAICGCELQTQTSLHVPEVSSMPSLLLGVYENLGL